MLGKILHGSGRLTPKDVSAIADAMLRDYGKSHDLPPGGAKKTAEAEELGVYTLDYEWAGSVRHLIRIYVKPDGRAEMHRMIE